jgi:hypothetical protein
VQLVEELGRLRQRENDQISKQYHSPSTATPCKKTNSSCTEYGSARHGQLQNMGNILLINSSPDEKRWGLDDTTPQTRAAGPCEQPE